MTLLDQVDSPASLKELEIGQLTPLAEEIRKRIIQAMSTNGGHLASNLGTVELSLALHYVYNSPDDRLIFDVSHQTYTHKLLTGRNDARFDKIRKSGGLNGFAHPKESPHDHFYAGHAGTALSLALGMAHERDISKGEEHIIPIIGDATLTCGLSLEALNNIQREMGRFIVVLNDNEMSISHPVGGINNILSRLINNPTTNKLTRELEHLLSRIPRYGNTLADKGVRLTGSIKNLVSPAPFFEQFGLSYIGPIDGHDVEKLIAIFSALKDQPSSVIIHLYTKKGQGVEHAENDPVKYHGVKPFDPTTCEFLPSPSPKPTFPKIFGKHLLELGNQDPRITTVTPAMSLGSCLDPFKEAHPSRFFDVGIAEGHAVTFAAGLAKTEQLKVFCSIYSTFFHRALDNLFQDVCLQQIPVIFPVDRAGLAFGDGATHHGIYEISFLKTMPNMVICQPRDGHLLKELVEGALIWNKPTAIRYPNISTDEKEAPIYPRQLGKGEVIEEGEDLLIIALGHMVYHALELRQSLSKRGISAAVIDPIFLKPLDSDLLSKQLLHHTRIITLEEHSIKGGLGQEINAFLLANDFENVQVLNFGIPEAFFDHGSQEELYDLTGLSIEKMEKRLFAHFRFAKEMLLHS